MIRATHRRPNFRGLGATTSQQINASLDAAATGVSLSVPVIGPIIGASLAAVGGLIQAFGIGNGCGGSCTESTQVVNQIIPMMQSNLAAAQQQAQANGGCLLPAEQSTSIANFQQLWATIVQQCTMIGGGGGKNCIADRQRGGKYDCFVTLLDPIAAIPVCSSAAAAAVSQPTITPSTTSVTPAAASEISLAAASTPSSTIIAGVSNIWVYLAVGFVGFLFLRPSE